MLAALKDQLVVGVIGPTPNKFTLVVSDETPIDGGDGVEVVLILDAATRIGTLYLVHITTVVLAVVICP